jgi:hypothetical protein
LRDFDLFRFRTLKFDRTIDRNQLAFPVKSQHREATRIGVGLFNQLFQDKLAKDSIRPSQQSHV